MRRLLFVLASVIAVFTFSCDTTQPSFDDAVPGVFNLTTNVTPEEGGTVDPSGGQYVSGTTLEIEAIPEPGFVFERWEGDLTGGLNPTFLSMNRNRTVTAFFVEAEIPLTIEIVGQGTVNQEVLSQSFEDVQAVETDGDDLPTSRDGASDDQVDSDGGQLDSEIRGRGQQRPTLSDDTGSGTDSDPLRQQSATVSGSSASELASVTVLLTAVPDDGWRFDRWEGDLTGSENPDSLVVDEEKTVTAVFEELETQEFTLQLNIEGQGFIEAVPDRVLFNEGEEVTLTAVPEEGWTFSEWFGDLEGSENPETVVMDEDKEITSVFRMVGAPEMDITEQPTAAVAGEVISPSPSVQILSDEGDALEGVEVSVSLNQNEFASSSVTSVTTNQDGIALFGNLIIESAATGYRMIFDADDSNISNVTSSEFNISAAAGDPAASEADIPDGIAGEETEITIQIRDAFGNRVTGAAGALSIEVTGANSETLSASEEGSSGEYVAVYTPENAGSDEISIQLNGSPIAGSPFTSNVTTSDVSGSNSDASADPSELTVGETSVLTISVRDDQGNSLSGLEDDIQLSGLGDAAAGPITEQGNSGNYTTEITSEVPGEFSISISVSGVTLQAVPVITFLTGDPDQIEIVSGNNQSAGVTQTLDDPFIVRVTDSFGNPVEGAVVEFEISDTPTLAVGQSLSTESAETNSSGEVSTVLTLGSTPGTYTVDASSSGAGSVSFTAQAALGQPSQIQLNVQPSNTTAGDQISPAPEVEITDDEGNAIEGVEVSANLSSGNFAAGSDQTALTNSSGIASFSNLVITQSGTDYTIRFDPDASGLDDITSDAFDITPGDPDPASSSAEVPGGSAGDETAIVITVQDSFGNGVAGVSSGIELNVTQGPNSGASFSSVEDLGGGEYRSVYTPQATGTDQISIELNGTAIDGSPFISEVITTDADAIEIVTQPGSVTAGEVILGPPTVLVTDDLGNPVGDVDVTVSVQNGTNFASGTLTLSTNSSGTAEFNDLIIETAGNYRLTFNALGVSEDTTSDQFEIESAAPNQIEIESGNNQTGNVNQELDEPFSVRVADSFGNPVSGFTVDFEIVDTPDGAVNQSLSSESQQTNSSGIASTTLTLGNRVGEYRVAASSDVGGVEFTADAAAGSAETFEFETISSPQTAGSSFLIIITALDGSGNIASGYSGTADLSTTAGSVSPSSAEFSSGEASVGVTFSGAGTGQTITAEDGGISGTSNSFDVETGGASQAEIVQQPTETTAGETITPAPAVEITDQQGNAVSGVDVTVNLSSGSFASGNTSQATNSSGIALFDNLVIEAAGSYTITFEVNASGVSNLQSDTFEIVAAGGDPAQTVADVPDGTAGEETSIIITVEDQFGNAVTGAAGGLAVSVSGANSANPSVSELGSGEYEATYTPASSGDDEIAITLAGTPISGSPYTSTVSTSDISSSESTVSASPEELQAGTSSEVTIELRDAIGNVISGLSNSDFNISVSGNGSAGSVSELSAGTYRFSVSNTTAQQITVTVSASGVTLDDTPQITFTAADPSRVIIDQQPLSSTAGQAISGPPAVEILDRFNNVVPGVEVTVSEQDGQAFAGGTETVETNSSGIALFDDLVINSSGRYNLVFEVSGSITTTSNAFDVNPAEAEASQTTASVPNGSAGDATSITITVRDAFENRVEGAEDDLSVSVGGTNSGATVESISDDGNGVYTTEYTPTANGTDQITIELRGTEIPDSPFTSNVITSDAETVLINQQPMETVAGETIAGPPSVRVEDNLENPVEGVEVVVSLQGSGSIVSGTTTLDTGSNGIAEFDDLVVETAGSYSLSFNAIGVSENAVSEQFDVVSADEENLSRVSGNNQTATVTEPLSEPLTVRVTDAFGNPVSGVNVEFSITDTPSGANGQTLSNSEVATGSDGLAASELILGDLSGSYTVSVSAGAAGSTTFSATAEPGAVSIFSFDFISSPQTAGQPFGVSITALDDQGNTATGFQGTADLSAASGSVNPNEATFTNGTVSIDVELNTASDNQTITATADGISGSSNEFDVLSGGVDPNNSSVSADPEQLQAGESSEISIELRDGSNNLVSGRADDISISVTGSAGFGDVSETSSGDYITTVSNNTAETVTVSVSVNGVTLSDTPSIEFSPADAEEIVEISGNNQTGNVLQQLSNDFVVRVADAFDNPVPGSSVEFSITQAPSGASGQTLSETSVDTDSDGTAASRLTLGDSPGTYEVTAQVSGVGTVTFSAEAEIGAPSVMTIVTQPENTRAGNPINPSPQVLITDDAGNPVEGISVTVSEEGGYTFDGGTLSQSTNASGIATFDDLVIQSSGRYALVFNASASGVPNVTSNRFNVNPGVSDAESSTLEVPDGTAGEETEIKIRVEDEFGNTVDDAESDLSVSVTGANEESPAVSFTGEAGEYTAFYTPLNSGDDIVAATLDGVELSNSPQTSVVTASEVSASESIVQADPGLLQVGNESTVTIELKDAAGNAIAGLGGSEFSIDISGEGTADPVNETNVSGIYEFNVGNETAQTVTVTATVSGVTLDDRPEIEFTPGDVNIMAFDAQPGNAVAGEPISGPPTVFLEDDFGNRVPGIEVTVTEQSGQSFESGNVIVETNASGVAEFSDLVITSAGQYNLVFSADGVQNLTSNAFNVASADADPGSTIANVPGGSAGDPTIITITVEDEFGNPVAGVAGDLSVAVTGGPNEGAAVSAIDDSDDENGIYTTSYTPTSTGDDEITIELNGTGIQDSPFTSTVITSEAETVTVEEQPQQTVAGQPIEGPPAAVVRDGQTNPVPGIDVVASLQSGSFASGQTTVQTATNGISEFSDLVITQAGSYVMEFNAQGVADPAPSNSFEVVAADADELAIESGNNQTGTVTESLSNPFVVQVTDEFGNPVENEDVTFEITDTPGGASGQSLSAETVQTDGDGFASATLTLGTISGDYEVTATAVGLTPVVFTATAESGPAASFKFDEITSPQTAGQPFAIFITAEDSEGNTVDGYNGTANLTATAGSVDPATIDFSDGMATADVALSQAGSDITLTATDGSVEGTSNAFDVQTGGVDAANSSASADPTTLQAGENSTLTIELRDENGNPVSGLGSDDIDIALTGDASADTITEPSEGTYTAAINNNTAETVTATITASGTTLNDTPTIEFTPADADPDNTTADVPNGAAGDPTTVVITVQDEFGNSVTGVASDLSITVTDGPNTTESFGSITDNNDGTYSSSYTPQTVGDDEITIQLDGTDISGSPYTSTVSTSDVSASNSSVTADPLTLQAGNSSLVTIDLRDTANNPIGGLSDSDFSINVSGNGEEGEVNETTTTGTYEFEVSNSTAQEVTVTVTATGTTLEDTPEITFTAADPASITIDSQPGDAVAGQIIPGEPAVDVRDEFNNPVPGVEVIVTEQDGQTFASGEEVTLTNASGIAVFDDLVINNNGRYNLVFTVNGGVTVTSNAFDVDPADADPAETTAVVPNGAAGDQTDITITVRDAFGNRVDGVAGDLAVSIGGANDGAPVSDITGQGDGVYTTNYTPTTAGDDIITITLADTEIQDSPFTSTVITSDAETVEVSTQPQQTIAGQPVAGPPAALVLDDLGNTVSGIDVIASLDTGSFASGQTTVSTDGDGISEYSDLVINEAGSYVMEFNAQGVADPAPSNSFEVVAADAEELNIESGNNQTATITESLADPFVVQVTDEFGNAVENEEVSFEITDTPGGASGQTLSEETVQTDGDGFASATLTLGTISGDYEVTATAGGLTPVIFTATAESGQAASFAFDEISSPQTAGEPFTISITAQDSEGNTTDSYEGTATLSATTGSVDPSTIDFTDGTATASVALSQAGSDITLTAGDGSIEGSSNAIEVQSGGVDAANSTASADPTTLQAGQSSTLTIELRDGSNNPVSGLDSGDIDIALTGDASPGTITEPSEGTYTATISNNTAEIVTATITASGTQLNNQPQIEFTPGDASAVVEVSGNNQTGTVLQSLASDFVVRVVDQFENPVPNATVSFDVVDAPADSDGESLSQMSLQTNSAGEAATRLTLGDTPGTYITDAVVDGVGTVSFSAEAGIGEPSEMIVSSQPGQTTAGEAITPAPAVTITDNAGNEIEGVSVSVSEQGGASFDGGTLTQSTNATGVAEFPGLIFNSVDTYTLVFNADASAVPNVNSDSFDVVAAVGSPANTTADVPNGASEEVTTITITVRDSFGNRVTGAAGDLSASVTDGPNAGSTFDPISDDGNGTYSTAYTPETVGTDQITIQLGGVGIADSPFESNVSTSDVSSTNSTVIANPTELQAGNSSQVTVEVRDAGNNPIPGLASSDFNISVSGDGSPGSISETVDGTYTFGISNNTAEEVTVTVTVTGTTLADQPEITFTAADPDLMIITTEPGTSEAGQQIAGPPTVRFTDQFNNPVPDADVTISVQGGQPFSAGSVTEVNSNESGFAIFDNIAIETANSSYNLVFSSDGVTNRTSNAFAVLASAPDASQSSGSVPNGSVGDPTPISITLNDPFGNRVEGAAGDISVTVEGANEGATVASIIDEGNGIYSTSYSPTTTGTDQIVIEVLDVAVPNSPFDSEVITTQAENVSIQQQPLETVAGNAVDGPPSVVVTDEFDNPVEDIEVNVSLNGGSFEDGSGTTINTGSDGIAAFPNLLIESAGSYTLEFNAVGVSENAVSGEFDVIADVADDINLSSGNNQTGTVTEQLENPLIVSVIDQFGNPVQDETVEFEITDLPGDATGQTLSVTSVSTDADGLAATDLTLGNRTGSYGVTASGTGIGTVVFSASAVAGEAAVFQFDEISSPQSVDSPFSISITALDSEGNTAGSYQGTADLTTTAGTITPGTVDFSNGTASLEVEVSNEETGATITATDFDVAGTSNAFNVESSASSQMSITEQPTETVAGEVISPSPAIQLLDGDSDPISGIEITATLSSNSFSGTNPVTVTTDGSGNAVFSNLAIETAAEEYTITFDADLEDVADVTSNLFDITPAAGISIEEISGSGQTGEVNTQLSDPFVVRVVDDFGNVVQGEDVLFTITDTPVDADGQSLSAETATSDSDGLSGSTLTLGDTAGTYTVEATFNGVIVTFSAEATEEEATP